MSLQSTIHKLNNDLISLFAVVDAWLDKDDQEQIGSESFRFRKIAIVNFLVVNKQLLDFINKVSDDDLLHDIRFDVEDAYENVSNIIQGDYLVQQFLDAKPQILREHLREQLFQLLCLIDALHDKRLNVMNNVLYPQYASGLDAIRALICTVAGKLKRYEEQMTN